VFFLFFTFQLKLLKFITIFKARTEISKAVIFLCFFKYKCSEIIQRLNIEGDFMKKHIFSALLILLWSVFSPIVAFLIFE